MSKKKSLSISEILLMSLLIAGFVSFFGGLIALGSSAFTVAIVFGSIFVVCLLFVILYMIVDKVKRDIELKKEYRGVEVNGSNEGIHQTYTPPARKLNDEFLKKTDDYIATQYPSLPLDDIGIFSFSGDQDALEAIREMAYKMQSHVGLKYQIITIEFFKGTAKSDATVKEAGNFRRTGALTAEINLDQSLDNFMLVACLAHEMAHAYQSFSGKQPYADNTNEEEFFTDLLTFYLGFTKIVKSGYYGFMKKLGYIADGDFLKIEEIYSKRTSAPNSYVKEKEELKQLSLLYESMVEEVLEKCESLSKKYLPPEDKTYILELKNQYGSEEEKAKIRKYNENVHKRSKDNLDSDIVGLEIRIENLMKAKEKLDRIYNYIFSN